MLLVRLLLNVQQHFSHIYSFHGLELGQRVTITTGQRRSLGLGVEGQNICFAAFFALFHGLLCRFSDMKRFLNGRRKRTAETSEEIWRLRGPRESKGQENHAETLWAQIPLHIFSSDQSIHCLFVFFPLICQINWSITCRLLQVINQLSSTFPPDPQSACGRSYTRM